MPWQVTAQRLQQGIKGGWEPPMSVGVAQAMQSQARAVWVKANSKEEVRGRCAGWNQTSRCLKRILF
jgi:hypothetical protein